MNTLSRQYLVTDIPSLPPSRFCGFRVIDGQSSQGSISQVRHLSKTHGLGHCLGRLYH